MNASVPRVAFIASMPRHGFSGGRLLAITFAEALGHAGLEVTIFSNLVPHMARYSANSSKVSWVVPLSGLERISSSDLAGFDVVFVVPQVDFSATLERIYSELECTRAKSFFLSFETPNWFSSLRADIDEESWAGWRDAGRRSTGVITISKEAQGWASSFYGPDTKISVCYPPVNTWIADMTRRPVVRAENRAIVFSRTHPHKGLHQLEGLLSNFFCGWKVDVFLGRSKWKTSDARAFSSPFRDAGVRLMVRKPISTIKKFQEIARSTLLIFPTEFEGFGIPPLEARYCGIPAVVADLPVLREVGDRAGYFFYDPRVSGSLEVAVMNAIKGREVSLAERSFVSNLASPSRAARQLMDIMQT